MVGKIFQIIYTLIFTCIVLVALLLVVSAFPIPGNFHIMTVLSGSMEPAIKTGSIVVVVPQEKYEIGDVITFGPYSKSKPPTTHRVVEVTSTGFATKGDANDTADFKSVLKSNVIGKVFLTIPYLGYTVSAAQKPLGFTLLIVIPALLLIWDEVKKIKNEIKKKSRQTEASALAGDEAKEKTTSKL